MATQTIETVLALKDQMTAGLTRAGNALGNFGARARAAVGEIGTAAGSVSDALSKFGLTGPLQLASVGAGIYSAVEALRELTKEGIDLNRTFENTSIRIAGTLNAFNVAPTFAKAQAQAAGVMGTVAELAASLPGETEDYISVFATALPKAIAAGMTDMQEVAKFTSYWTAIATTNMVDANQAGMDLFRMLSGQAGADVRMFTVLAELIGKTAEDFNKLSAPERLAAIQAALTAFKEPLAAAGAAYEAKAGEMESRLKEIKRLGSEVAFEDAKKQLEDMNTLLKASKNELIALNDIGTGFTSTIENGWNRYALEFKMLLGNAVEILEKGPFDLYEERMRTYEQRKREEAMKPMREAAAAQEAALAPQRARIRTFKEEKFADVEALLPEAMRKGLGAVGLATPKIRDELIKLGKARKDDVTTVSRIADYLEFMQLGNADLLYTVMTGRGADLSKSQKDALEKAERERTKKPKLAKAEHHFDFRNSRFDIKQEFAEGFDPDRIAVAFAQDLGRAGEMRTQSGFQQAWTTR